MSSSPVQRASSPSSVPRTVVLAMDDSTHAWHALEYCLANVVSPSRNDRLFIVTVALLTDTWLESIATALRSDAGTMGVPFVPSAHSAIAEREFTDHTQEHLKLALDRANTLLSRAKLAVRANPDSRDVHVETVALQDTDARQALSDFVNHMRPKADVLVVGSRGLGAIKRAMLGSTSHYCLHHCHCPVLVVRDDQLSKEVRTSSTSPLGSKQELTASGRQLDQIAQAADTNGRAAQGVQAVQM